MPGFTGRARRRTIPGKVSSTIHLLPTRRMSVMRPVTCAPSAVVAVNLSPIAASSPIPALSGSAAAGTGGAEVAVPAVGPYDTEAVPAKRRYCSKRERFSNSLPSRSRSSSLGHSRHDELHVADAGAHVLRGFARGSDADRGRRIVHAHFQAQDVETRGIEPGGRPPAGPARCCCRPRARSRCALRECGNPASRRGDLRISRRAARRIPQRRAKRDCECAGRSCR